MIHVASVHQYNAAEKTFKTVPGSGGVSAAANQMEARYALSGRQTSGTTCAGGLPSRQEHRRGTGFAGPWREEVAEGASGAHFSPLM